MVISNLAVLAYARGFTHWLYRDDTASLSDTLAPGFFSRAAGMIETGDLVTITASDGTAIRAVTVRREVREILTVDTPDGVHTAASIVQPWEVRLGELR